MRLGDKGSLLLLVLLGVLLVGCARLGPDYSRPELITPDSWNQALKSGMVTKGAPLDSWWQRFNDPALNRLVTKVRAENLDLAIGAERVFQARALRIQAASPLFPQVFGGGNKVRTRNSENAGLPPAVAGQTVSAYSAGFDVAWELDFFGALRRGVEAAAANEAATVEQLHDLLVSLDAETALAFIELRTASVRAEIIRRNLKVQEESLELARNRFEAGLVPEIDVTQAQANLETTRSILPTLRQQRAFALNRLAVLIGGYPNEVEKLVGVGGIPMPGGKVVVGLPADLLRNRPDVRAAERRVAAQNARIGASMGELYPRFSLTGSFNLQALSSEDLLESGSRNYGFGPGFRWNLFNAGFVRSQIELEKSRTREAALQYENVVLGAVAEVENGMATIANERDRLDALTRAVSSAQKTVELIRENYSDGIVNFQNVLDAERVQLQSENELAASQGLIAAGYARLFKALGGGIYTPSLK